MISKDIKKFWNANNNSFIIGFLTITIILWLVLNLKPVFFSSLFFTFLGKIILLFIVLAFFTYNKVFGILLAFLFVIIFRFGQIILNENKKKEGFQWNKNSSQDFLLLQNTINPNIIFDIKMIQKNQASQLELDYFNKYAKWPWSDTTKDLYLKAIKSNPFVRISPESSLEYVRTVYNETSILILLSYQTKEGQFLLNGILVNDPSGNLMEDLPNGFGNFAYKSGQLENLSDDVIKCNMENPYDSILERITYTGRGGIYEQQTSVKNPVDYNDLENIIPGFTFLNKPCNPCGAINLTPDYSCPFKLEVKNKPPFVSDIFQYLWNITDNPLKSLPSFLSEEINPNEFPILNELQSELLKQNSYTNS